MTERIWTVDYQIFPNDLDPLGNPKGACFAYDGKGNELDCAEIETRLNATERLLKKAFRNGRVWSDVLIVQDALRDFYADIREGK